jgi:hypothetical protein
MEDELRPLPAGWVREFDPDTQHQFFVDTMSSPPRSIWHHPYDDDVYLASLPAAECEQIQKTHAAAGPHRRPSAADIAAEDTAEDTDSGNSSASSSPLDQKNSKPRHQRRRLSLGRRLKDHLTGTTHEQRAAERARRAAAEHELYRQHRLLRQAMRDAMRSGRPQLLGRDPDRVRVFLEPPGHTFPGVAGVTRLSPYVSEVVYDESDGRRPGPPGRYLRPEGDMYGMGYGGYGCGKFAGGRWDRPGEEYARMEGTGFGGGMGVPLMAPLLGGVMLGSLAGTVI